MTDRHVVVRDLIVHRYMDRNDLPNDREDLIRNRYLTFRKENGASFDHLEDLAWNLGKPEFKRQLDRLTDAFSEWCKV